MVDENKIIIVVVVIIIIIIIIRKKKMEYAYCNSYQNNTVVMIFIFPS